MSQRLWEHPEYSDKTFEKLQAKLEKCIRQKRYREAQLVAADLAKECDTVYLAEKATRGIDQK